MLYKSKVYISVDEESGQSVNPNETLGLFENDVTSHQICGARMRFLNSYFINKYGKTVQEYFSPNLLLVEVAKSKEVSDICLNNNFNNAWKRLENNLDTDDKGAEHSNKWNMEYGYFADEYNWAKLQGKKGLSEQDSAKHQEWLDDFLQS